MQGFGTGTNTALVSQEGGSNTTKLDQRGVGTNQASISQTGMGNGVYGLGGVGTFATQMSTAGDPNVLTVSQQAGGGVANNAFVGQTGAGNVTTITQTGMMP